MNIKRNTTLFLIGLLSGLGRLLITIAAVLVIFYLLLYTIKTLAGY